MFSARKRERKLNGTHQETNKQTNFAFNAANVWTDDTERDDIVNGKTISVFISFSWKRFVGKRAKVKKKNEILNDGGDRRIKTVAKCHEICSYHAVIC